MENDSLANTTQHLIETWSCAMYQHWMIKITRLHVRLKVTSEEFKQKPNNVNMVILLLSTLNVMSSALSHSRHMQRMESCLDLF